MASALQFANVAVGTDMLLLLVVSVKLDQLMLHFDLQFELLLVLMWLSL